MSAEDDVAPHRQSSAAQGKQKRHAIERIDTVPAERASGQALASRRNEATSAIRSNFAPPQHQGTTDEASQPLASNAFTQSPWPHPHLDLNRSTKAWKTRRLGWVLAEARCAVIFGERFTRAMTP